jgi:hypothetical protein
VKRSPLNYLLLIHIHGNIRKELWCLTLAKMARDVHLDLETARSGSVREIEMELREPHSFWLCKKVLLFWLIFMYIIHHFLI